ncbi:GNAT family N-acetyltransferase [Neobacillus sp. PS3-12]|uniref:GNAT family N-acetyltransferase n=1 Tax=Neobacillus sp. PS3-12 TaxID=3070677 RepID=UPI0027E17E77|nr:GNAT family N-acetyltransferase [Neobacillus sp. PS3-12]WML55188.1 GNAT family N-acetyltransferase [Neobacillus sp. PS3-12]
MENIEKAVSFYELKWDTEFFDVSSAKAILHKPLSLNEWHKLQAKFTDYQFISITNQNSDPVNTQLIGKDTLAFLADVNVQFIKKLVGSSEIPTNVTIHQSLERNDKIIELADFKFSKFTEDLELAKRGGDQVYHQWLINAFKMPDKFFALSKDENDNLNGFVLYSFADNASVIELIAVSPKFNNCGIGSKLFKAVEYATHQQGFNEVRVGTQIRNIGAINFYHKVGCEQVGCHQVYHLWN